MVDAYTLFIIKSKEGAMEMKLKSQKYQNASLDKALRPQVVLR